LYCDGSSSLKRRATLTTLHHVFECLTKWLAPVLCFTAEEVWQARYKDTHPNESVHLTSFPEIPESWKALSLENDFSRLREIRRVMTGALEASRAAGDIGSSLQASLDVYVSGELMRGFETLDWAEITITSHVTLHIDQTPSTPVFSLDDVPSISIVVKKADGEKCQRCWKVLPEVGTTYTDVCTRCHTVLNAEPVRMPHAH